MLWLPVCVVAAQPGLPDPPRSGIDYAGASVRAMQADDAANPGMWWVTRGEGLWQSLAGRSARACADCHRDAKDSMKGVAAKYPRKPAGAGRLQNLEGRINQCREHNQLADPLRYESEDLLALTVYVVHQSRGMPMAAAIDDAHRAHWSRGRETYFRRQGQMNLACANCHDDNAGKKLLNDTISQGHGNAYPLYRLEWQGLGSLHRRFRACYFGIRAERPDFGSDELLDLELYLAWRATGLPVETPGVRR